jgi:indole-3-glycerol phosphate synthase
MSEPDFLATMAARSRDRVDAARARRPQTELLASIRDLDPAKRLQQSSEGFDLIAEMKLRSPALGQLRQSDQDNLEQRVASYAEAGAAAVSVLTEPSRFDGALEHLERAALALESHAVPTMRKDFLVDPYQVLEARAAGAGGVLLILRMLPMGVLASLFDTALEQGLFILLEAFDERDVETATRLIEPRIGLRSTATSGSLVLLGVNCRDLVSLQVIPGHLETLAPKLPHWLPRVAESGLASADDARRLAAAGYDLALVGSALMSGDHPRDLAAQMLAAGRSAKRSAACS